MLAGALGCFWRSLLMWRAGRFAFQVATNYAALGERNQFT